MNKYATIKYQPDQKIRILLISNNTRQHEQLLQSLLAGAFRVSVAADGVQGYTKAQLTLPELILLDKQLTGIDALSLTHMLQGLKATAQIPIIILDSRMDGSSEECVAFLKAGAVDYIGNPYAVDEVKERINVPLRCPKQMTPAVVSGKTPSQRPSTTAETSMLIHAIQKTIDANLGSPPSQKELCEMFKISRRKIMNIFQRNFGLSVSSYIRLQRMYRAEYLLKTTALKIDVIATDLGFSSPANFSTAFKAYAGVAPGKFRQAIEKNKPYTENAACVRSMGPPVFSSGWCPP
ncbi:helix-turn-helix domain-containing protein [Alcaligenes faecalis]|uniref:AraC family transcriptional regulator n=1 Tax=Alcaligenes faecalis TaxID=511 RepID=A0A2U2BLC2_ALCFA|nr:DNA-binding response regulator [Alcaligenes faecalis]PWE14818.1 AraC family transcriptional regulator [Alcaligenes faecalis]QHS35152.1 helix-turn-helix domain-containing protein [Alcaligenes faecalis]